VLQEDRGSNVHDGQPRPVEQQFGKPVLPLLRPVRRRHRSQESNRLRIWLPSCCAVIVSQDKGLYRRIRRVLQKYVPRRELLSVSVDPLHSLVRL
jgi:hypothetical protein